MTDQHDCSLLHIALAAIGIVVATAGRGASQSPPSHQALSGATRIDYVWANSGEDKVTRDELRAFRGGNARNSVWNGRTVQLFAARNETVSFNLILEAAQHDASGVQVTFDKLAGPNSATISSRAAASGADLFNYVGRNIELFYVRYLPIKGVSLLAYDHYDERHIPRRLRRPHDANGYGHGTWKDRPDHDKPYPEIAVPLELHTPLRIAGGTNQSVWVDIYVPKQVPIGMYRGQVEIREQGETTWQLPVELQVLDFSLPDLPMARTMLYLSRESVNRRYLGVPFPGDAGDAHVIKASQTILDRHFQLAHRHKISLIDEYTPLERMDADWAHRLNGELFTQQRGYEGVGAGVGNNVYCIGAYSTWPWPQDSKQAMWRNADAWVRWFESQSFRTPTDYFLFLIDESTDFATIERWSQWMDENPGPGKRLLTMVPMDGRQSRSGRATVDDGHVTDP